MAAKDHPAAGRYVWDVGIDADALAAAGSRHLADLRRAYPAGAPPDIRIRPTTVPLTVATAPTGLMTSPAAACASEGDLA